MRIKGGRDYYDMGMAYGQDPTIVFVRKRGNWINGSDIGLGPVNPSAPISVVEYGNDRRGKPYRCHTSQGFRVARVLFCGKCYRGLKVHDSIVWNTEDFLEKLESHVAWGDWSMEARFTQHKGDALFPSTRESLDVFFASQGSDEYREAMLRERITIATNMDPFGKAWLVDSEGLKGMGFHRVVPPMDAFNAISNWIANEIPAYHAQPCTIADDKVRLEKRGFDSASFRKAPGKKRKRK